MNEKRDPRTGPVEIVPTDKRWPLSARIGVLTGGVLFVATLGLLAYGYGWFI